MKKINAILERIEPPNWVLAILTGVFILRIPSFFEPYNYGDEMIYLTLGNAIRKGITLYSQIHDNKTPLIYFLAALAGNLFWFKAILLFWMLITIIIFWHLTKVLFEKNLLAQKISVLVFAIFTTIPLLEGNIVNAELFLIGPIILGILILLNNSKNQFVALAGFFFAISFLFKVPAVFDVPVVFLFWLITIKNTEDFANIIRKAIFFTLGFLAPIILTLLWYATKGALSNYITTAFIQNISYVSPQANTQNISFVVKNSSLIIKAGIVLIGLIILRLNKSRLSKAFMIGSIWLLTSLFAATLSGRPYPHYLVQVVPATALLIGILVSSKKFEQVLAIFPLTLLCLAVVYYHFWYYQTASYYERFVQYATNQVDKNTYVNKFNGNTTNNYNIAKTVQQLAGPNEKIFVWGEDAPVIYALSRRLPALKYVANYHINDYSSLDETISKLKASPPNTVVVLPKSQEFTKLNIFLLKNYMQIASTGGEIWHLRAPGIK